MLGANPCTSKMEAIDIFVFSSSALMPVTRGRLKLKGGDRNIGRANGSDQWDTGSDKTLERAGVKVATMGAGWYPPDHPKHVAGLAFNTHAETAIRRISEAHRSKSPEKGYVTSEDAAKFLLQTSQIRNSR
mgnify:CR=1 FL=1